MVILYIFEVVVYPRLIDLQKNINKNSITTDEIGKEMDICF
jgi:hypothetical protein